MNFFTIQNFFRLIAVFTMHISIVCLLDIPGKYFTYLFVLCVFIVQQLTHKYTLLKRINDFLNVFRILFFIYSLRFMINSNFNTNILLFVILFIVNMLLLYIPEFETVEDYKKNL